MLIMGQSWQHQQRRRCLWALVTNLLFLSLVRARRTMHPVFLETNMKAAWTALLDAGNSSSSGSLGDSRETNSREIVDAMLADCHSRNSGEWGAECDRASYLESVLKEVHRSSRSISSIGAPGAGTASLSDKEQQQQKASLESAANEIALVSAAHLTFSAFFHEYAVPRRPVAILSQASASRLAGGDDQQDSSRASFDHADHESSTLAEKGGEEEGDHRMRIARDLPRELDTCLPYPVDPTGTFAAATDTVDGPLWACRESLLGTLLMPIYISEDFAQRFRGKDVLPVQDHADVERFVSGWQRIHRTRRGAYIPATVCPAGANTLVTVVSGTLEVLVYSPADGLPCLKPTFGDAPCAASSSSPSSSDVTSKSGAKNTVEGKINEPWSDVDDENTIDEANKEDGSLDVSYTSEGRPSKSSVSPITSPREPLERVFGLVGRDTDGNGQSLPHKCSADEVDDEGKSNTRGSEMGANDEGEQGSKAASATESSTSGSNEPLRSASESPFWPHEPRYCADIWKKEGGRDDGDKFRRDNAREISTGDNLFVPSGGAVSWRAKEAETTDDEAVAIRFCFVDASNFNAVKSQLPLYAAVEAGANGLLRAFRSPVFDTSMARDPSAVLAADFIAGDRHAAADGTASSESAASFSTDSDLEAEESGAAVGGGRQRRRRRLSGSGRGAAALFGTSGSSSNASTSSSSGSGGKGGRRGRKSFKEWQDDSRWDLKVLGLTLPTLDAPRVLACGRTACTVEWTSSFVKRGQDQTTVGFNLSFVPVATSNASTAGDGGFMQVGVGDSKLKSEHALDRNLLSLGITEGKRHTLVVDTDLVPDTPYRFSVSVVYGETTGPFSEYSKTARTTMVTAPLQVPSAPQAYPAAHAVTLHFLPPPDDGGSPVSWYHVMSRPTGENVLSKWQAVGMSAAPVQRKNVPVHETEPQTVAVTVEHLVPGVAYQFRVCAQNDVGTSPWSSVTDPVLVPAAAVGDTTIKDYSLSGFYSGHRHLRLPNVTDVSVSYAGETEPPPGEGFDPFEREVHGPTVVLDDRAETVRVDGDSSEFQDIAVWACHFSPRAFRVKAEVVVAQPADARGELENGRFVRNRVVVVERGVFPLVHKVLAAQRAGAIGVIVADDGRCGNTFGQLCVYGSDPPAGWAALDMPRPWLEVRVPVVLMLREDAERLTAAADAVAERAESMAWSSLYDGWLDSMGSSSSSSMA